MPPIARTLFALLLATLSFSSIASEPPQSVALTADLSVSAEGRIVRLEFLRELSPELEQFLRARVLTWTIEPARRGGRAVGGDTTLYLDLSLEPAGKDVIVRVAKASTGPRQRKTIPPIYPADAIRRRRQAIVFATADVRADGTVAAVSARMVAGKGDGRSFVTAAERSIARWTFVPERVDGVPVATRVQVPIEFRLSGQEPLRMPVLEANLPPPEPNELVAESEFSIAADVLGRAL